MPLPIGGPPERAAVGLGVQTEDLLAEPVEERPRIHMRTFGEHMPFADQPSPDACVHRISPRFFRLVCPVPFPPDSDGRAEGDLDATMKVYHIPARWGKGNRLICSEQNRAWWTKKRQLKCA